MKNLQLLDQLFKVSELAPVPKQVHVACQQIYETLSKTLEKFDKEEKAIEPPPSSN